MKNTISAILFLLVSLTTAAQIKLSGTVVDESNEPLIGVSVIIKDTKKGTITDLDGNFTVTGKKGDIAVISYIGYEVQQKQLTKTETVRIVLQESLTKLDELVVVGYGEFKREDITGSVAQLETADIIKAPVPNINQALSGRIAGVQVTTSDAQPGTETSIIIRGANSMTQDNSPLYVVDGFPMESFDLSMLNSSDIEAINVLKDASATAIYGSRGANGVIIVETKKGALSKPTITYDGTFGLQSVSNTMDLMTPLDFVNYQLERDPEKMAEMYLTNPGLTMEDYARMKNIDWQDKIFRTSPLLVQSLSMYGGSDKTRYTTSLSYTNQEGVVINSGFRKYQGRIRLDQTVNSKLKVGANINYSHDKNYGQVTSEQQASANAYTTYLMYRTWGYRPINIRGGSLMEDLYDGDDVTTALMNPVVSSNNEVRKRTRKNLIANATIDYAILPNLNLKIRAGMNERSILDESFNNTKTYKGAPNANNSKNVNADFKDQSRTNWMNENILTYRTTFNKFHKFDVTGAVTLEGDRRKIYGFSTINIPIENLGMGGMDNGVAINPYAAIIQSRSMSYLGRINYNYRSRYMLTASFRADGSSKFSKGNQWGYFPSAALAWNLSNEKFMKKIKPISNAKIRTSYGKTGNNRINEDSRFQALSLNNYYSFNNSTPGYATSITNLDNKDLKWETTDQVDLGFDLSLFSSRINLTVDLYRKTTNDLLLNAKMPATTGTSTAIVNVGKVRNEGLEISLTTKNVKTKNFSWESNFNIAFNKSKVLDLVEESIMSTVSWTGDWNASYLYMTKVGDPMAAFYGYVWDGVYQYSDFDAHPDGSYTLKKNVTTNGNNREIIQPGDIKYVDQNNDGVVNDQDRVVIGNPLPIHTGGLNNNFTYKNFSLNIFLQWSYGNDVFNANRLMFEGNATNRNINQFASYNDRWTPENQSNENFRIGGQGPRGVYSSRTIEDGSFLRLKTVQLSYTLPKSLLKNICASAEVFVAGQDLYTWTNYSGMDPEVSVRNTALTPGFDYSAYPRNRTFSTGVKVTF